MEIISIILIFIIIKYGCLILVKYCKLSYSFDIQIKILLFFINIFILFLSIYLIVRVTINNNKFNKKFNDVLNNDIDFNDNVTKKLNYYYNTKSIDGAVLINGTWGSGKTYYIEKYVANFNLSKKEERAVYVSLNGLKSIAEVNNALFAALHPVLSATKESPIIKVICCAAKYTADLLSIDYDSISEINIDLKKFNANLIVFDDLERCQVEITELFGYIDLIKKTCPKIILVTNEIELINYSFPEELFRKKSISSQVLLAKKLIEKSIENDENKTAKFNAEANEYNIKIGKELDEIEKVIFPKKYYEVIKEKIVWNTIPFVFNINIVFKILTSCSEYKNIEQIILNNKNLICEIENQMKCSNLRTYKCSLDLFSDIYTNIQNEIDKFTCKDDIIKILIVNVFASNISYKQPLKFDFNELIVIDSKEYNKLKSIIEYYNNISYEKEELIKELSNIDIELSNKEEPDYIKSLKHYWNYKSDDELTSEINKLYNDYVNDNMKVKYYILCYHWFYMYIKEYNFTADRINLNDIKEELLKRINEKSEFIKLDDYCFIEKSLEEGEKKDIRELYDAITAMVDKCKDKQTIEDSFNISNISYRKIESISQQAIGRKAFLSLFYIGDLMNFIENIDNKGVADFRSLIYHVYEFSNLKDFFENDKNAIQEFIKELEDYIKKCKSKIKIKLINWLIDDLRNILGRL